MTQRIELFLEVCLKEFNSFSNTTQNFEPFFFLVNTTQRIELFYEHDWKIFSKKIVTQRIETFFFYDSRIEPFFFSKTTQSTDFFQKYDSQNCNFFFRNYDSKNWIFGVWLKELNLLKIWLTEWNFFLNMTHRIEPFFFEYDQRIGLFSWIWSKELNRLISLIWRKKLDLLFKYDEKNWTLVSNMTPRNELFSKYDSQNSIFFLNLTHRIEPFFLN